MIKKLISIGFISCALLSSEVLSMHNQHQDFNPVPKSAKGPSVSPNIGFKVQNLGRGLYIVHDGSYQMMFLTTGKGVIVVDAPPTTGQNILTAISSVTSEPITHVIYSHAHKDHIGAAHLYPDNATIIAHEDTLAQLAKFNDPDRPIPTKVFKDKLTLTLGNQKLQLDYRGLNHSPGNIYIYAPEQQVLMLVDVIFPGWSPFKDLAAAESIEGFIEAHDIVLDYHFKHIVGGHLTRTGDRDDVIAQKQYIQEIWDAAKVANNTMDFNLAFSEATKRKGAENPYAFIDILFNNIAEDCAKTIEDKWKEKLGGVDVFTFGHCMQISWFQRLH